MNGINCPTYFYYVLVPGIVSASSSCCYLLSSEAEDRLPRTWLESHCHGRTASSDGSSELCFCNLL